MKARAQECNGLVMYYWILLYKSLKTTLFSKYPSKARGYKVHKLQLKYKGALLLGKNDRVEYRGAM
jgi:hypothetical protein